MLNDNQKVGDKVTLENILFQNIRHSLLPESFPVLDTLVSVLQRKKEYHILILGHVCCAPPGIDGLDIDTGLRNLSVARAKAIYDYLVENGIDASRLAYKGMKGDYPTGRGDKFDRRVEIQIMAIK